MKVWLWLSVAAFVHAQGPGDGLSKTTYGASNPLPGMSFLIKLLNNTPAEDSNYGNIAECAAGTSGQTSEWYITEGRSQLITTSDVGTCQVLHGSTSTSGWEWGPVAMTPPTSLGSDCSYMWRNMVQTDGGIAYTVAAHTQDTCCKTCAADPLCTGAVYLSESSSANSSDKLSMPEPGEGFGMHLTAIPGHETTGGLSIEQVEEIFTSKVGSMDHFDWFMDYNVGFFTSSLDSYIERLRSLNTSFLSASWPALENTWYSVLVHVPGTQMVVELMGSKSDTLPLENTIVLEQRMTAARIEQFLESPPADMILSVASVSRASSNLAAIEEFYTNGVGASVSQRSTTDDVTRLCFLWSGAKGDVCFTNRADESTAGSFKPKDFETMLHTVHSTLLTNPNCAMDRWVDNHYAMDLRQGNCDGLMNYVVDRIGTSESIVYTCSQGRPHYVFDPSGWGIQLDMQTSVSVPGCSSEFLTSSPWCGAGTCDSQLEV